jgi:hypothetical protein
MILNFSLTYEPDFIISMVGPSRSGSSIMKWALSQHPQITSLLGEEEPYYKLARNGYPWHPSDEFHRVNNPEIVKTCIANELMGDVESQLHNRKYMQDTLLEEPPFVEFKTHSGAPGRILLLKTPQNCYRRGVLGQLYPKAKVVYIRTRRSLPAIVNGLMDGWLSDDFKARKVGDQWWKFDMPPRWSLAAPLEERCVHQAKMASDYCNRDYSDAIDWHYEEFCDDWQGSTFQMFSFLKDAGIPITANVCLPMELPILMATEPPGRERWRDKRPHLEKLCSTS